MHIFLFLDLHLHEQLLMNMYKGALGGGGRGGLEVWLRVEWRSAVHSITFTHFRNRHRVKQLNPVGRELVRLE